MSTPNEHDQEEISNGFQEAVAEASQQGEPFITRHTDPQRESQARQQTRISSAELEKRFTYHPPKEGQQARYVMIRAKAHELAALIAEATPFSREQSIAITHIEDAVMWANAAIARNE